MMKIAIPTRDNLVDDHFGHCDHYTVFTVGDDKSVISSERLDSPQGCGCKSNIASVMQEVRGCHGNVNDVLTAYLNGTLTDSAESCNHHDCGNHDEKPVYVIS